MPQHPLNYGSSATCEYLRVIRQHVIKPLETTAVAESCFASVLLICGAIDGLGKLTHENANASPGQRFKAFLQRLGNDYSALAEELWHLRNTLAHSAMNIACFLSKQEEARSDHLERERGFVFIHTGKLLEDFKAALNKLETEYQVDGSLLERAESRLRWDSINERGWRGGGVMPTPPPGIEFVQER